MLIALWVKITGGFWAYRTRVNSTNNRFIWAIRSRIYAHYLEGLCAYIALGATFDGEPILAHKGLGVFIAPDAKFGTGVRIHQQVTIGDNDDIHSARFGAPTIGNNVDIGGGAKIIGKVTIGDGARIGAGAIVVTDVPAYGVAISPKAVIRAASDAARP